MDIVLHGLSKAYKHGSDDVLILKNISLTIKSGEIVSVVGPSGSGKSTLLSIMSGINLPSEGKVMMDGRDLYSLSELSLSKFRREHFGFVFQQFSLIPNLNVRENIELPILFGRMKPNKDLVKSICSKLGIEGKLDYLPSQLSGGQQQRVAIARAVITNPDIIFADEPTGNLDQETGDNVIQILLQIARENHKTLVIVTHDRNIADLTERKIIIVDGKTDQELRA